MRKDVSVLYSRDSLGSRESLAPPRITDIESSNKSKLQHELCRLDNFETMLINDDSITMYTSCTVVEGTWQADRVCVY
jgi:hypothetical protein